MIKSFVPLTIVGLIITSLVPSRSSWAVQTASNKPALSCQSGVNLCVAASSATLRITAFRPDQRLKKLTGFLQAHHSPLAPYAKDFIKAADRYRLDWRLLPAITGVESNFGKQIPPSSFNAYGWNNGHHQFESWKQSIDYVTCQLRKKYLNRGLDTPTKIGPVYAPPSRMWSVKVDFLMEQIENFPLPLPLTL